MENVLDDNFWEHLVEAEGEILSQEQDKLISDITIKDGEVESVDERHLENIDEVYSLYGDCIIHRKPIASSFMQERGHEFPKQLIDARCYDSAFRIGGVLRNFIFKDLVERDIVDEQDKDLFLSLFTLTAYSRSYDEELKQRREDKEPRLESFKEKYSSELAAIKELLAEYSALFRYSRNLPQEIETHGSFEEAIKATPDDSNMLSIGLQNREWKYFNKEDVLKMSENIDKYSKKYSMQNFVGHKLAYAIRFDTDMNEI
ncbi:MAG: hypothetical protein ACI8V7_000144 [Candidatus Paceibacteria bacterium]